MALPSPVPPLHPSLTDQAERLVRLGVHDLAGISADWLREAAAAGPSVGVLVTGARPSALALLLTRGDRPGFVVEDMTDVDLFAPTEDLVVPATPYVVSGLDRGEAFLDRTPAESVPEILAAGRFPLTLEEGLHWVLQQPEILERNACFMTPGSRLRTPTGAYDARTPALWISNGTGRDGRERRDAPKLGWCWWGNRHTWLGIASCEARTGCDLDRTGPVPYARSDVHVSHDGDRSHDTRFRLVEQASTP